MALKTKCIKHPREATDGFRISIMSRHTLNDGVTPDKEITAESYDAWWPELAPPAYLIGAYYKKGLSWEEFERAFAHYLMAPEARRALHSLMKISHDRDVTILCVEKTPEHCHRRLVAEACRTIDPSLEIIIE